jgi:branched-chain amino acid transport system permease protein
VAGFAVGVIATLGAVFFPQISNTLIFILMVLVLLVKPTGLFGVAERTA